MSLLKIGQKKNIILLVECILVGICLLWLRSDLTGYFSLKNEQALYLQQQRQNQQNSLDNDGAIIERDEFLEIIYEIEKLSAVIDVETLQFQTGPWEKRQEEVLYYRLPVQIVWQGELGQIIKGIQNLSAQKGVFFSSIQLQLEDETTAYLQLAAYGVGNV